MIAIRVLTCVVTVQVVWPRQHEVPEEASGWVGGRDGPGWDRTTEESRRNTRCIIIASHIEDGFSNFCLLLSKKFWGWSFQWSWPRNVMLPATHVSFSVLPHPQKKAASPGCAVSSSAWPTCPWQSPYTASSSSACLVGTGATVTAWTLKHTTSAWWSAEPSGECWAMSTTSWSLLSFP